MTEHTHIELWKRRAERYNKIAWVTNYDLLHLLHLSLELTGKEKVLDAGIGTGILAKFILEESPNVNMYGLDSSPEMIEKIDDDRIFARVGDLREIPFVDDFFDRVILRNVLHHCVGYTIKVIEEIKRVLKPDGKIVICEGVPINNDCISDFSQIVTAKENRLVFTTENFVQMLYGFRNQCIGSIILKQQSVMNWLSNCVDSHLLQIDILDRHYRTSEAYKKAANLYKIKTDTFEDVLVDMKFMIARGTK